jgi:hypothetical protein
MEQSDAERQLVGLLRGLDVPEFSLQISIKEKRSDPLLVGGPRMAFTGEPDVDRDHGRSSGGRTAYYDERRKLRARLAAPGTVVACHQKSCGAWWGGLRAGGVAVAQRRARRGRWRICDFDCGQGWTLARELARSRRRRKGQHRRWAQFRIRLVSRLALVAGFARGATCTALSARVDRQSSDGETRCRRQCVGNHRGAPALSV